MPQLKNPLVPMDVNASWVGVVEVFKAAMANYRVWMLFVTYGACFGIELFVHNVAASYYVDHYKLTLQSAGTSYLPPGAFWAATTCSPWRKRGSLLSHTRPTTS